MSESDFDFITPVETAKLVKTKPTVLAVQRCKRTDTPPWYKLNRKIFYKRREVLEWIEAHRVDPAQTEAR
jgi:hypothetical protein